MLSRLASRRILSSWNVDSSVQKFTRLLGKDQVKTSASVVSQFEKDEGHFSGIKPKFIVIPRSVEEVSSILRQCNEDKIPLIPFGSGTGLEGGVVQQTDGITMVLNEIEGAITSVNEEDFDCSVRPSVTRNALNDHLRNSGLFFPVDPGADASLCGMAATGASGTNAVRYGTMKENVLNLEVVLPDGRIISTKGKGRRARKSSAGLNLTELFVGSEGILGVITETTLRLHPRPQFLSAAVTSFPNIHDAVSSVVQILQSGIPIARIELLDDVQVKACNSYSHLQLEELPTLFLEFHGYKLEEVESQAELAEEICQFNSMKSFESSSDTTKMTELWKARHNAYYSALSLRKGAKGFTTDVCVPITKLGKVVEETKKDLVENGIIGTIVGHVGDGNFHVILPVVDYEAEIGTIKSFSDRLVRRALDAEGTCTGEHGVGLGKRKYLKDEMGLETLETMKILKKSLDPNMILNPGKVLEF